MMMNEIVLETIVTANNNRLEELRSELKEFCKTWERITEKVKIDKYMYIGYTLERNNIYMYAGSDKLSYHEYDEYGDNEYNYDSDPEISVENLSYETLSKICNSLESNVKDYFRRIQKKTEKLSSLGKIVRDINRKLS